MKRRGRHRKVYVPYGDRKLSSSEIAKKYYVSRITAWRVRTGKQNFVLVPVEKEKNMEIPRELGSEFNRLVKILQYKFQPIDREIVKDVVADRRLFIIEYYAQKGKRPDELVALWYTYAYLDLKKIKKSYYGNSN